MWEIHKSGSVRSVEALHFDPVQAEIEALGGEAASFPTDVSRETDVIALVRTTVSRCDRLDILISSAGIGTVRPFVETTTEGKIWRGPSMPAGRSCSAGRPYPISSKETGPPSSA